MSDFVEWNPKHHGHKPLHWTPDMLTSVDGKNFVRQSSWAWIAGSTYYVPHEAVGIVREAVEEEPVMTYVEELRLILAEMTMDYELLIDGAEDAGASEAWAWDARMLVDKARAALEKQP